MKLFPLLLCFLAGLPVHADDVQKPLKGGLSPGGKTEIRLLGNPVADTGIDYTFGFFKKGQSQPFFRAQVGGGFYTLDGASGIDFCSWNEKSSYVAISDHGSRHSLEVYVFAVRGEKVEQLDLPDFGSLAKAKMTNRNSGEGSAWCPRPDRWEGDKLVVKLETYDTNSEIVLGVSKASQGKPIIKVISESDPIPNGLH